MTTDSTHHQIRPSLRRPLEGRMVAGVAAGVADHLGLDPLIVRVGIAALTLLGGAGVPLYLAAWLLVPEEGAERSVGEDLLEQLGIR